ncbi:hypothetical protein LZ32DRAFT_221063 [Colletotrichum eremochloae]|nr:hypothetical protein LZ32DRAFT_221063 [Colletotrichum eremochloae]
MRKTCSRTQGPCLTLEAAAMQCLNPRYDLKPLALSLPSPGRRPKNTTQPDPTEPPNATSVLLNRRILAPNVSATRAGVSLIVKGSWRVYSKPTTSQEIHVHEIPLQRTRAGKTAGPRKETTHGGGQEGGRGRKKKRKRGQKKKKWETSLLPTHRLALLEMSPRRRDWPQNSPRGCADNFFFLSFFLSLPRAFPDVLCLVRRTRLSVKHASLSA